MSSKKERIGSLQFPDGTEIPVIGETDRYWLCEGRQFRKNNPHIVPIPAPAPKAKVKKNAATEEEAVKEDDQEDQKENGDEPTL